MKTKNLYYIADALADGIGVIGKGIAFGIAGALGIAAGVGMYCWVEIVSVDVKQKEVVPNKLELKVQDVNKDRTTKVIIKDN